MLRRIAWLITIVPLLLILAENPAEAYVDPGTASYLFQLLTAAALGGIYLLRTYWSRLITGVRSLVSRDPARE
jgi:predicted ATPase